MLDRRRFLKASVGAMAAGAAVSACGSGDEDRWGRGAYRKTSESRVAILKADSYEQDLDGLVLDGLRLSGLEVRARRVVLKPNLVEFDPEGVINTSPLLIGATVRALRRAGAGEVVVAEGPGHRRDNEYLLRASGISDVLQDTGATYVDLNLDDVTRIPLFTNFTRLDQFYLPATVHTADLVISMPKLKTHHWAGVTLSMKNLFGLAPGSVYGWPKNVLHWAGIENSIIDINAALEIPRFNIVDGIVGMEGNGPIQGAPRHAGVVVFGSDPVAVDATSSRIMGIDPWKIPHIALAGEALGNAGYDEIVQTGASLEESQQDFKVLDRFQAIKL